VNLDQWDFPSLVEAAMSGLRLQTEAHKSWGLGRFARWDLDQQDGRLVFSDPSLGTAKAPAQIAGSLDLASGTWLWAWANPSVLPSLARHSDAVRALGERRGFERLTTAEWRATEADAWAMAAICNLINGTQGAYRGPAPGSSFFITFGEVELAR
jgi:hypothetical protein